MADPMMYTARKDRFSIHACTRYCQLKQNALYMDNCFLIHKEHIIISIAVLKKMKITLYVYSPMFTETGELLSPSK